MTLWIVMKLLFMLATIVLLCLNALLIITMRRAAEVSKLPVVFLWKFIVMLNIALIALLFLLLIIL